MLRLVQHMVMNQYTQGLVECNTSLDQIRMFLCPPNVDTKRLGNFWYIVSMEDSTHIRQDMKKDVKSFFTCSFSNK